MKNKIIRKLKMVNCPKEYSLDIKCVGGCRIDQMRECWDKAFEKYELLVSDELIYKHQWHDISFAFKTKSDIKNE